VSSVFFADFDSKKRFVRCEKKPNYLLWHPGADTVLRPLVVEALGVSVLDGSLRYKLTLPSSNFTFSMGARYVQKAS
jgi:hypothetical protein